MSLIVEIERLHQPTKPNRIPPSSKLGLLKIV